MADEASTLVLLGRLLLGGLFLVAGIRHFWLMEPLSAIMAQRGIPAPRLAVIGGSIWEGLFGLLLILGIAVPISAFALTAFTVAASLIFLNFWNMEGAQPEATLNAALTNIAVVGGLLIAAAVG